MTNKNFSHKKKYHEGESRNGKAVSKLYGFTKTFRLLGPGLITGASDDDPSGIATYSQAGARFGLGMLWINKGRLN
jgi:Mn2+/Fe2+ NRAMP family transporter